MTNKSASGFPIKIPETSSNLYTFDNFMYLPNLFGAMMGMKPYQGTRPNPTFAFMKTYQQILLFSLMVFDLVFIFILPELKFIYELRHQENTFLDIVMTFAYISSVSGAMIKVYVTQRNRVLLREFIDEFVRLFPDEKNPHRQSEFEVAKYLVQTKRVQIVSIFLYFMSISTLNVSVFIFYFIYDRWMKSDTIPLDLPFNASFPWDYHGNWTYPVLIVLSMLGTLYTVDSYVYVDAGFYAFCQQLLMHFRYISNMLKNYRTSADREERFYPSPEGSEEDLRFLAYIAGYHVRLLRYVVDYIIKKIYLNECLDTFSMLRLSRQINEIFGLNLLLNIASSSVGICFLALIMTIGIEVQLMCKLSFYLITLMMQIYLICDYGQQLLDASVSISEAAYNQNWFNSDIRYKKMLIILALRADIPVTIQATALVTVRMTTLTTVLNPICSKEHR